MAGHIGSSDKLDWCTPHWIRDLTLQVYDGVIDLDPASNSTSIMGAKANYILPANDGLVDPWNIVGAHTRVFLNPPFGRSYMKPDRSDIIGAKAFQQLTEKEQAEYSVHTSIADWVTKANFEYQHNRVETVMLLPASVDTGPWQNIIFTQATSVCFLKGRVRFLQSNGQMGGPAPMACAIVYWGWKERTFDDAFAAAGRVIET